MELEKEDTITHYRGRRLALDRDISDFRADPFKFGDIGSSVGVPMGWKVQLFEDTNFRGKSIEIIGPADLADLHGEAPDGRDWGDKFSSMKVDRL